MQIKRTTIPYVGRSRWGADGNKKTRRRSTIYNSGGSGGTGAGIGPLYPSGTAMCELSLTSSYIYDTDLPATITMDVIGQVNNQRVPTYVLTENITGGYPSMTITVTDNGTDHAVLSVALPANFMAAGKLTIPVLVNSSTGANIITPIGTQTMEDAFTARTKTTKQVDCFWEYSILHVTADGTIIRGPIRWTPNLARRFSNGQGPLEEDRLYMDVIRYNHNTYKCITSYTQTAGSVWASVSSNWQMDNSFNYIAVGLDLDYAERIELDPSNLIVVNNGNSDVITIGTEGINAVGTITCGESRTKSLNVVNNSNVTVARITGSGDVIANHSLSSPNVYATDMYSDNIRFTGSEYPEAYRTAARSPFVIEMAYITDNGREMFTVGGAEGVTWEFNGVDTRISATEYPYFTTSDRSMSGVHDYEYFFTREEDLLDESSVPSGVFTSQHTPTNNRMYFNLDDASWTVFGVTTSKP